MEDNNFFSKFPNLQKVNNQGPNNHATDEEIMAAAIEIWRKFGREILMLNKEDFPKPESFDQTVKDPKPIAIVGRPIGITKVKHEGSIGRDYYAQQLQEKHGIQFDPSKHFIIPVPTNLMGSSFLVIVEYPTS